MKAKRKKVKVKAPSGYHWMFIGGKILPYGT